MEEKPHKNVVLIGGGGHAKVVADCLLDAGRSVLAVVDKTFPGKLIDIDRISELTADVHPDAHLIVAIGDNKARSRVVGQYSRTFANAVHPSALVSRHAIIGKGNMILHRAVVQAGALVGDHVIINTGAQIDHDCTIGSFSHIARASALCGAVAIGEGTLIGAGSVVLPGVKVGAWVIVGAGTVVRKDVPDYAVVAGNPGKIIRFTKPSK